MVCARARARACISVCCVDESSRIRRLCPPSLKLARPTGGFSRAVQGLANFSEPAKNLMVCRMSKTSLTPKLISVSVAEHATRSSALSTNLTT